MKNEKDIKRLEAIEKAITRRNYPGRISFPCTTTESAKFREILKEWSDRHFSKSEPTYKVGQRFMYDPYATGVYTHGTYILASAWPKAVRMGLIILMNVDTGIPYDTGIHIKDSNKITQEEFNKLTRGDKFDLID